MANGKYELVNKSPILDDVTYDVVERITTYGLPAVAAFYLTLSGIWGFPNPEAVSGTIMALVVLLRVFLGIAKSSYRKSTDRLDGTLELTEREDGITIQPNLSGMTTNELSGKREVTLAITQPPSQ
jgi:hypothetical protein